MKYSAKINVNEMMSIFEGLQFNGFNTQDLRKRVKEEGIFTQMELVKALQVYIFAGTKYREKLKKVKNEDLGRDLSSMLTDAGLKTGKSKTGDMTLSQLAQAYCPVLYHLRYIASKKNLLPSSGVNTTVDLVKCDVAFQGCSSILEIGDISDFIMKFSVVLRRHKEKKEKIKEAWSEDKIKEEVTRYTQVARAGLVSDIEIQGPWTVGTPGMTSLVFWLDKLL